MKKKAAIAAAVIACYAIIYVVIFQFFYIGRPFHLYTPDWSARHFLWIALFISLAPIVNEYYRYPFITFGGYIVGIVLGELLGGFESNTPPQYLHHGWSISIFVFLASAILALILERRLWRKKKR